MSQLFFKKNIFILLITLFILNINQLSAKSDLLLDRHPGAKGAYSLRKLRSDYEGAAIQVLRTCDKATKEIGFKFDYIDTDSMLDFIKECEDITLALPLDIDNTATAAYSTRRVNSAYAGAALEVRRADNEALLDIGFNLDGTLNIDSLAAHCAGVDCYVSKWYDQSNNGHTATTTDPGFQAKIYDANTGVIKDTDGFPALYTDGADDMYITGIPINRDHLFQVISTQLEQTNYGWMGLPAEESPFRPILGNNQNSDRDELMYGVASANLTAQLLVRKNGSSYGPTIWQVSEKMLTSFISHTNGKGLFLSKNGDTTGLIFKNNNTGNYGNLTLFGQTRMDERRYRGYTNEIIYYNYAAGLHYIDLMRTSGAYYQTNDVNNLRVNFWYDQGKQGHEAGFNSDIVKPLIYDHLNGGLVKDSNGKLALKVDGVTDMLDTGFGLNETHSFFSVAIRNNQWLGGPNSSEKPLISNAITGNANERFSYGTSNSDDLSDQILDARQNGNARFITSADGSWLTGEQILFSATSNSNSLSVYKNDSLVSQNNTNLTQDFGNVYLFSNLDSFNVFDGNVSEIVIYDSDKDAERVAINKDIGSYYQTYDPNFSGFARLRFSEIYRNTPAHTKVTEINFKDLDAPHAEHTLSLIDGATEDFYLKNNMLFTKRLIDGSESRYPLRIRISENGTDNFRDLVVNIKVLNRPFNSINQAEPGRIQDDEETVEESDDQLMLKFIDLNKNKQVDFEEVVLASKVLSEYNLNSGNSPSSNTKFKTISELSYEKLLEYLSRHKDYEYISGILTKLSFDKTGINTFKESSRLIKLFKRVRKKIRKKFYHESALRADLALFDYDSNGQLTFDDRKKLAVTLQLLLHRERQPKKRNRSIKRFMKKNFPIRLRRVWSDYTPL